MIDALPRNVPAGLFSVALQGSWSTVIDGNRREEAGGLLATEYDFSSLCP